MMHFAPHAIADCETATREWCLEPHGYFTMRLTHLPTGRRKYISIRYPWRLGPPKNNETWCAAAWRECFEPMIGLEERRERVRIYEAKFGPRPMLPFVRFGGAR